MAVMCIDLNSGQVAGAYIKQNDTSSLNKIILAIGNIGNFAGKYKRNT